MFLAGLPIPDRLVLELARRLRNADELEIADKLEHAWRLETTTVALETHDREAILRLLADGPEELAELRAVLLQEHERRRAGGH